jgi:hypothetical protein
MDLGIKRLRLPPTTAPSVNQVVPGFKSLQEKTIAKIYEFK